MQERDRNERTHNMKQSTAKTICLALALTILSAFFPGAASAAAITKRADGMNTTRESGTLIIYTPAMGATTGTNEWGYEAVIENDRCTKLGGGNNAIPANGFVLSGHDEDEGGKQMGKWIKDNVHLGDYVYYNANGDVTVSDSPIEAEAYYEVSTKINGVNVTRNENFMVVYNKHGSKTGTNQWGYEAIVTDGFITGIGGNDNTVPGGENSFVISGHGTAVDWIQENAKLGMRAEYDAAKATLTLIYDELAALTGSKAQLAAARDAYDAAVNEFVFFDSAAVKKELDRIEAEISATEAEFNASKNGAKLSEAADRINAETAACKLKICESRPVEYRAAWLRPTQTSAKAVDDYVETLYQAGINTLCIETLYGGTMIMPMPEGSLFEVNPQFRGFDMLQSYIDSCHRRGMELHCWLPIFYVGNATRENANRSPGMKKPEWLSKSNRGKTYQDSDNYMMIDPGNAEACDFLLANYKYILETYDIDGFQLDYIRYWTRTPEVDFGYNEDSLKKFNEKYGVTPTYDPKASWWKDWVDFRAQNVTDFVGRVRKLIDEINPDVLLGADVVPDPSDGKQSNYQDYFTWMANEWIDIVFPMSYGFGYEQAIKSQTDRCGDSTFIAVGLGIFMQELENGHMFDQITYNRTVGADGSTFFEANAYMNKSTGAYLLGNVYAEKAITPYLDRAKAAATQADYAISRVKDVILPNGGANAEGAKAIAGAIEALKAACGDKEFDRSLYEAAAAAAEQHASAAAAQAIKRDLRLIAKIYNVATKQSDVSGLPDTPSEYVPDNSAAGSQDPSGEESVSAPAEQSGEESAAGGEEKSSPLGAILIAAAAAIAVGAALFAVLKNRKKK